MINESMSSIIEILASLKYPHNNKVRTRFEDMGASRVERKTPISIKKNHPQNTKANKPGLVQCKIQISQH